MKKSTELIFNGLCLYVIYHSIKSIIDGEIASYKNATKFDDPDLERGVKQYYQWSLKNKK